MVNNALNYIGYKYYISKKFTHFLFFQRSIICHWPTYEIHTLSRNVVAEKSSKRATLIHNIKNSSTKQLNKPELFRFIKYTVYVLLGEWAVGAWPLLRKRNLSIIYCGGSRKRVSVRTPLIALLFLLLFDILCAFGRNPEYTYRGISQQLTEVHWPQYMAV